MLAAALGGLDAFVFTAGIGENSPSDPRAHRGKARLARRQSSIRQPMRRQCSAISRPDSRVALIVVPTDEELMIAQHTLALLSEQSGGGATGQRLAV